MVTEIDQGMYGLLTPSKGGGWAPAKKPTRFLTNSRNLVKELSRRCDRQHVHQPLMQSRAAAAARYPEPLCRAICEGLLKDRAERDGGVKHLMSLTADTRISGKERLMAVHDDETNDVAWDDVSGALLDPVKVKAARRQEIEYIKKKNVHINIQRKVARQKNIGVIQTRWVDVNKGDVHNPSHRSRLVGKEFNDGEVEDSSLQLLLWRLSGHW